MKSKVLVICTGGTFSMVATDEGRQVRTGDIESEIRKINTLSHRDMPAITFKEFPLIDSSQMTIAYWNNLAEEIYNRYDEFDGFVILHGTDTMAYTGAALSFMFENLGKPIILTGAQTPLSCVINDAQENLINAVFIAGNCERLCQVALYFNRELLAANRATKVSTEKYAAYESPNFPRLGTVGASIEIHEHRLPKSPSQGAKLAFTKLEERDIRTIHITPAMTIKGLRSMITDAEAVILESYGDGNLPASEAFLSVLKEANARGVILINRSQCLNSNTSSALYSSGMSAESCGIISAGNQTIEAITAKLTYLMTKGLNHEEIKKQIIKNLRGELTTAHTVSPPKIDLHGSRSGFFSLNNSPIHFTDVSEEETEETPSAPVLPMSMCADKEGLIFPSSR